MSLGHPVTYQRLLEIRSLIFIGPVTYHGARERERGRKTRRTAYQDKGSYESRRAREGEGGDEQREETHKIPYLYRSFSAKVTYI